VKESVIEIIHRYAPARLVPVIEQNIKESLILRTSQRPDEEIPIGRTKVGGKPDLPNPLDWLSWQNKSLSFIAQINLADLPEYDFLDVLPPEGLLSFFYSASQETWGLDPKDKDSWKVIYFDDKYLQRRDYPPDLPEEGIYNSCSVEFHRSVTIPELESPYIDLGYGKSDKEINQFMDLKEQVREFLKEGDCINRLLGHPKQQ
jgi:uncharacterized protein YwqG